MTDRKVFKKFLKAHKAFKRYKRNITELNDFLTYDDLQLDRFTISSAFPWILTEEGMYYWLKLDHLWVVLLETKSKQKKDATTCFILVVF